jgi:chaperonin cofactor prefoldin
MDKFFSDLKKTFNTAASKVAKKSGKMYEISKLTLAISAAKGDINDEYEKIGRMIYEGYKNKDVSSQDVTSHCELIDAKFEQIEKYREKLSELKDLKQCPVCKAELSKDSTFCANCGEKL